MTRMILIHNESGQPRPYLPEWGVEFPGHTLVSEDEYLEARDDVFVPENVPATPGEPHAGDPGVEPDVMVAVSPEAVDEVLTTVDPVVDPVMASADTALANIIGRRGRPRRAA